MGNNARLAAETIQSFFDLFGSDIYAKTVLGVLLQGLKNEETLFLLGEQGQIGRQTGDDSQGRQGGELGTDRSQRFEITRRMGQRDPEDYL